MKVDKRSTAAAEFRAKIEAAEKKAQIQGYLDKAKAYLEAGNKKGAAGQLRYVFRLDPDNAEGKALQEKINAPE